MIQVLVVDDEIHCAEGVKYAIDWGALGVDQVWTAYSMTQAQKIIIQESIDIIISDVEMPKGSGFDMLRWIRDSRYTPVVIMLTSYATFEYAKLAIEFQCLDYLLKPVAPESLFKVARRAVDAVLEARNTDVNNRLAQYWNANERNRVRHFWREIIEQPGLLDSQAIMARAKEQHIVFDERNRYLPVLYKIHSPQPGISWNLAAQKLNGRLYAHVFQDENQVVLVYSELLLLAIAGYSSDLGAWQEKFRQGSREFIDIVQKELQIRISAYMGEFKESGDVAPQYVQLLEMDRDNVSERSGIHLISERGGKAVYERPDVDQWMQYFSGGNYERTVSEAHRYVDRLAHERRVDRETLARLLQDFMQAFYITVGEKEIQAHLLLEDEASVAMYGRAALSVKDFKAWVGHIVEKAEKFVNMASDADSVVKHVQRFIRDNLGEELSRGQIAAEVCMSPDYVSRVFRQETGIQLSEYITEARMEEARHLLETTDLPVGEVAYKTGYYNIAYFSRVFRIRNNATPASYRAQFRKKNG